MKYQQSIDSLCGSNHTDDTQNPEYQHDSGIGWHLSSKCKQVKKRCGLIAINANTTSAAIHIIASMRISDAVIVDYRHALLVVVAVFVVI